MAESLLPGQVAEEDMEWESAANDSGMTVGEGGAGETARKAGEEQQAGENQGDTEVSEEKKGSVLVTVAQGEGAKGVGKDGLSVKQAEGANDQEVDKLKGMDKGEEKARAKEGANDNPTEMDLREQREIIKPKGVKERDMSNKTVAKEDANSPKFWDEKCDECDDPSLDSESINGSEREEVKDHESVVEGQHDDDKTRRGPGQRDQRQPSHSHHLPAQRSYQPSSYDYQPTQRYQPRLKLPDRPSSWSTRDTKRYRDGYPGKRDDEKLADNYRFYMNEIPFRPNGMKIDDFHREMWGNYDELEWNHSFIQWLFPIREQGMNWHAQELQLHEVDNILANEKATKRLLFSYKLMLDFYGIQMDQNGELSANPNCQKRFQNLNHSSHNYLRITRILKCLGEFKMEHLKAPFIEFMLHEAITTGRLRNVLSSCMCYWVEVLKKDEEREEMWRFAGEMVDRVNAQGRSQPAPKKEKRGKSKPESQMVTQSLPVQSQRMSRPGFRSTQKEMPLEAYGIGTGTETKEVIHGTGAETEGPCGMGAGTEGPCGMGTGMVEEKEPTPDESHTGQSGVEDGGQVEGVAGANGHGGKIRVEDGKGEVKTQHPATASLDGKHNGDQGESKEGDGDGDREGKEGKDEVGEEEQGGGGPGNSGGGEGEKAGAREEGGKMGEEKGDNGNGENKDK